MSGTRIKLTVGIKLPETVTDAQIEEWLRYRLGLESEIRADNPLADTEITVDGVNYRWVTV